MSVIATASAKAKAKATATATTTTSTKTKANAGVLRCAQNDKVFEVGLIENKQQQRQKQNKQQQRQMRFFPIRVLRVRMTDGWGGFDVTGLVMGF
jgi:hypothetical protein